jgi:peptide deformylase
MKKIICLFIAIFLSVLIVGYWFLVPMKNNESRLKENTMRIAYMGNLILYKRTQDVIDIHAPEIAQMAVKLKDVLTTMQATGFAAPQLLSPLRMMIISVSADRTKKFGYQKEIPTTVLINPTVQPLSNEITMTWEGCYSIPHMMGLVPRYQHIQYSGYLPDGKFIIREATGFHAFIIQHEYDHLNGILYPMRIKDFSKFGYVSEFAEQLPAELIAEYKN